jgi:hypothetical protein
MLTKLIPATTTVLSQVFSVAAVAAPLNTSFRMGL